MDRARVEELEALLAKHAEPWEAAGQYVRTEYCGHGGFVVANCSEAIAGGSDTAMFIAAMRMEFPALLRLARAVVDARTVEADSDSLVFAIMGEADANKPFLILRADAAGSEAGE